MREKSRPNNRMTLVTIAVLIVIVLASAVVSYRLVTWHVGTSKVYLEVWHDGNGDAVANVTTETYQTYLWKQDSGPRYSSELFRSNDDATTIQWAIDHSIGVIRFDAGTYLLNVTITVHGSHKYLLFMNGSKIVSLARPIIRVVNASDIRFDTWYIEG